MKPLIIINSLLMVKNPHDGYKMINKQEIRPKIIIANIVPILILLILFWRTAAYPYQEHIVAEINGESLTYERLLRQYNLFLAMSVSPEQNREKITLESYLERYIIEMLMLREATNRGIRAPGPDDVRRQEQIYLSTTGQTEDTLSANLIKAGFSMEDVERFFEQTFVINTLLNMKFGNIEISDGEAQEFYSGNPGYFNVPDRIKVSHILICHRESQGCKSNLTRQEAKKTAEHIRNLATPANFAELARQYSMDTTTATDGGNLGYTHKGMAAQAFEDAAFKLNIGEISDPIETDFGFHIIYMTDKQGTHVTTFEEAKKSIKEKLKNERVRSMLRDYSEELWKKADIKTYPIVSNKAADDKAAVAQGSAATENLIAPNGKFRTFKDTGRDICRNYAGLPVIILFSSSRCPHCRWIEETFESSVMEYVKNGLIEAHHYDLDTKNDLLTAAVETEIPQRYYDIYLVGDPEDYVPYFNFGCKYDRVGNGYEKQDDYASEAWEFHRVIDTLLSK
jgi:thiol-disulfide isomerase/thioredoxin